MILLFTPPMLAILGMALTITAETMRGAKWFTR